MTLTPLAPHNTIALNVASQLRAAYDRGRKFERYRLIESLREVLLIEQDRRHIDLFRREADDRWVLESFGPDGELQLASLDVKLTLESIYEDVDFTPRSEQA